MSENNYTCPNCGLECDTMSNDEGDIMSVCCGFVIMLVCLDCGGEGSIEECEYERDCVNYGPDWIVCPSCQGTGYVTEREWQ